MREPIAIAVAILAVLSLKPAWQAFVAWAAGVSDFHWSVAFAVGVGGLGWIGFALIRRVK